MATKTSETKWTPGPWTAAGRLTGGQIRVAGFRPDMTVALVNGRAGEQEANAALIAAAPGMYAALVSLNGALAAHAVGAPLPPEMVAEWQRAADAALALAEGR